MNFLPRFFGIGNAIGWDVVQNLTSGVRRRLDPFLALVEKGAGFACLPRRVVTNAGELRSLRWYFLCRDTIHGRRARELARAFLGPSFVPFPDRLTPLDDADPVEVAVLEEYGAQSFWVAVPERWPDKSPVDVVPHEMVRMRLEMLVKLLDRRPLRTVSQRRPVGRVLRDFEFAVTTAEVDTARRCLEELVQAGDLNAANRQFLTVRIDGMRQAWDGLLEPARLSDVLDLAPPRVVVQVLVDAFYCKYLLEFDHPEKAAQALERFKTLMPTCGRLFRSRSGLAGRSVDLCFMLDAVGFSGNPGAIIESILSGVEDGTPQHAVLLAVSKFASEPVSTKVLVEHSALQRALERYNEGALDEALRFAVRSPHCFGRTALLVRIAAELQTMEPASAALGALDSSSIEDLDRLAKTAPLSEAADRLRGLVSRGLGQARQGLPEGWLEWLECLQYPQAWNGAVAAASVGEREWDMRSVTATAEGIEQLASMIGRSRPEWSRRAFRDAAPVLVRALGTVELGVELRPVHEALFLEIATDQDVSAAQWRALADLTDIQLAYGLDASSYRQQVDMLGDLLSSVSSPRMVLPALGFFESLCDLSCPSAEPRLRFASLLHAMMAALHERVDRSAVVLFASLARSVGMQVEPPEFEAPTEMLGGLASLRGKIVALYSLNVRALERARRALQEEAPEVVVKCFSDTKGGGAALAHAARSADFFVIVTAAATHAATGFIEDLRGGLPKRRVHRQGGVALLSAIRAYAEECTGPTVR